MLQIRAVGLDRMARDEVWSPRQQRVQSFLFLVDSFHSSSPSSSFRQPTTVFWQRWKCWASWHSAPWLEVWWTGLGSKWPSFCFLPFQLGRLFTCGRPPSPGLFGSTSSKISPSDLKRCWWRTSADSPSRCSSLRLKRTLPSNGGTSNMCILSALCVQTHFFFF